MKMIVILMTLLLSLTVLAQHPSENMTLVGRWARGQCRVVESSGNFLFYSSSSTLFINDVSNPAEPEELGTVVLPWKIYDIAVEGNFVYAVVRETGFYIIDITNPNNPTIVNESQPFEGGLIRVANGLAMVSFIERGENEQEGIAGFCLYDVSNPEEINEVSRIEIGWRSISRDIEDMAIDNQYAYAVDPEFGVYIFSISDPEEPQEVAAIEGNFESLEVANSILFTGKTRLSVYDIRDMDDIELLNDSLRWPGDLHYLTDSLLFGGASDGLRIYDISDLRSPRRVFETDVHDDDITNVRIYDLTVINRAVFVSCHPRGLYAFNFSDFDNPELIFNKQDGGSLYRTLVCEDRIYAYGGLCRLFSIDISDPVNPVQNGPELILEDGNEWEASQQFLRYQDYFYLFGEYRFRIVDASDPDELTEVGEIINVGGRIADVMIVNDELYVLDQSDGALKIYNLESPEAPQLVTSYRMPYRIVISKLFVQDDFAYIKSGDLILILDVSNPNNVQDVSLTQIPGNITELLVEGDILYASCGWWTGEVYIGSLQIVDVSDKNHPQLLGSYEPDNMLFESLAKHDNTIYIAGEWGGIRTIDVSNPRSPREIGYYEFFAGNVIALDSLIYCFGQGSEELFILSDDNAQSIIDEQFIHMTTNIDILTAYPNPFNSTTTITFRLSKSALTRISVYDISGRLIAMLHQGQTKAGEHTVNWVADETPSGIYICRLQVGAVSSNMKIVLIR